MVTLILSTRILIFSASAVAGGEATKPVSAWWYDIVFKADQDNVSGIPVKSLDPTWVTARALSTRDLVGRVSSSELNVGIAAPQYLTMKTL